MVTSALVCRALSLATARRTYVPGAGKCAVVTASPPATAISGPVNADMCFDRVRCMVQRGQRQSLDSRALGRYHVCDMQISRREFTQLTGTAVLTAGPLTAQRPPLTAQQVIDRIQANAGVPWQVGTLDAVKAGDPAIPVTGIATTGMARSEERRVGKE